MPSIAKIRIVNFVYNDGKRIIPDETIFFENDRHETLDTLINLINGGGKSVLVQLMLQPILPKVSIQGRRIEAFFRKSTDHCFILTEWKLDNSSDRLLSGIALAAGLNLDKTNNASVRFYTFLHKYSLHGDKNDINNMTLSQKSNGKFSALSYEEVRQNIKKFQKSTVFQVITSINIKIYFKSTVLSVLSGKM